MVRRRDGGLSSFQAGLAALTIVLVGGFFAYTRWDPFADRYELHAVFETADTLKPDAPVRIAGVDVGVVTAVDAVPDGDGRARITMQLGQEGLPVHEDAELKIRPRILLEGNEFVDLEPGSPTAPELEEGVTVPVDQTASPVGLYDVVEVLDSDTRGNLQTLLDDYSRGLARGGARGFRDSIALWEDAYRDTAIASEALQGTARGDLTRVIRGQQRTFDALADSPAALRGLVTDLNGTAAAFARQDDALQAAIPALRDALAAGRPALQSLNGSFPGIRRFAVEALPAVRSSARTVPAIFPFARQARLLFGRSELRGLARELQVAIPPLARLDQRMVALLHESRALSRCMNEVVLPFARTPIPTGTPGPEPADGPDAEPERIVARLDFPFAPDSSGQPFFEQAPRSFVGLAGESRTFDANGKYFRGNYKIDNAVTVLTSGAPALREPIVLLGSGDDDARPAPPPLEEPQAYREPAFRPDFPCELSMPPDLRAPSAVELVGAAGRLGNRGTQVALGSLIPGLPLDGDVPRLRGVLEQLLGGAEAGDR